MASNITVDTLTKGSTTLNTDEIVDTNSNQICKAWVNFNGTGTVAIRDSYNVSSITDGGTGYYTINFSSSMANANYSVTANTQMNYGGYGTQNCGLWATTTTSTTIRTMYGSYGAQDYTLVTAQIFSN
jgi:hypothetical protein